MGKYLFGLGAVMFGVGALCDAGIMVFYFLFDGPLVQLVNMDASIGFMVLGIGVHFLFEDDSTEDDAEEDEDDGGEGGEGVAE